jgi:REP element-mobilizing transposase RayT
MARVPRSSLPDGLFHVVARSVFGGTLFVDDGDRQAFVGLLRRCECAHGWTCHAFCLMTNHYHVVLSSARRDLSDGLHRLNGRYAASFNRRHGRFGHLFADRFSTRVIGSEEYVYEACAYVLLNPVRAGLCANVEDWPWSYSRFGLGST